jgi:tetratricopeptide (TPR) repeat protein
VEEAIASFRSAIALAPKDAPAHGALGQALLQQGQFAQALQATRRCLLLLPPQHSSRALVSAQQQLCEHLLALEGKLSAVRAGKAPASAEERLALAWLCQQPFKRLYASAARLSAEAFAERPVFADDLSGSWRYHAACAAALAGVGQGSDAPGTDQERFRLRAQALAWLRADLAAHAVLADKTAPEARRDVQRTLSHWRKDSDLAGVRDEVALAGLPEPERTVWRKLWAEVNEVLHRAGAAER